MKITLNLPDELVAEARDVAADEEVSLDEMVCYCIDLALDARAEAIAELGAEETSEGETLH